MTAFVILAVILVVILVMILVVILAALVVGFAANRRTAAFSHKRAVRQSRGLGLPSRAGGGNAGNVGDDYTLPLMAYTIGDSPSGSASHDGGSHNLHDAGHVAPESGGWDGGSCDTAHDSTPMAPDTGGWDSGDSGGGDLGGGDFGGGDCGGGDSN
jgi:hypothetical protein